MKFRHWMAAASCVALALTAGCKNAAAEKTASSFVDDGSVWGGFMAKFLDGYFPLNPTFAVGQGKHEFDGKLPIGARQA